MTKKRILLGADLTYLLPPQAALLLKRPFVLARAKNIISFWCEIIDVDVSEQRSKNTTNYIFL